jgi:hypothetical protein
MTLSSSANVNRGELAAYCFATASLSWILLERLVAPHTVFYFWIAFIVLMLIPYTAMSVVYTMTSVALAAPLFAGSRLAWSSVFDDPGKFSYSFSGAMWLIAFIAASLRMIDLLQKFRPHGADPVTERKGKMEEPRFEFASLSAILLWPAVIVLALLLLRLFPEDPLSRWRYRLTPGGLRAITFIWILGLGWLAVRTVVSFIDWIRMGNDEAEMIVRSASVDETIRELGAIERRQPG